MIEKLKEFIKDAGKFAFENQKKATKHLLFKSGGEAVKGIVTETDLEISKRFRDFVGKNFADLDYMIIDEETLSQIKGNVFEKAKAKDYCFVIDPIDGTMNYAADLPLYGIVIGVLRHGVPEMGLVYLPGFDELVYTDGNKAYQQKGSEIKELSNQIETQSKIVQGHAWEVMLKENHKDGELLMCDYFSAAVYSVFQITGRIKASFCEAHIWDIAGGWAILKKVGIGFFDYYSGKELKVFDEENFTEKNCGLKNIFIICKKEDFEKIKDLTVGVK